MTHLFKVCMTINLKELNTKLPRIVFKYECGMANSVFLLELYKSPELDDSDFPSFAKCGWAKCNCNIVDMFLDDGGKKWKARYLDARRKTKPVPLAAQMLDEVVY